MNSLREDRDDVEAVLPLGHPNNSPETAVEEEGQAVTITEGALGVENPDVRMVCQATVGWQCQLIGLTACQRWTSKIGSGKIRFFAN